MFEMSAYFKSKLSGWNVNCGDVGKWRKLCVVVILQKADNRHNPVGWDENLQLLSGGQLHLLYVLGHALSHILQYETKLNEVYF